MVLNSNKKSNTIASIIHEIYKLKINDKDASIEELLLDIFCHEKYDNLYQYNVDNKQINHIIKHSPIFAQSLSIIDSFLNLNEIDLNHNIFNCISSDLQSYINKEQLNALNIKELLQIFSLLSIKYRDNKECLEIKAKHSH